ncbi:hypothetical protein, variant [Exophiala oligosperma]|uniref:Uncharacterized protein n=1 Tax=Exophiala oligosperma TaxID=215243 RepID=A0A0D2B0Y6_9EURO|nr:hypothetical protein, variant [Exophiala oligosperma]KIW45796.1 hypothetical protein, variant [Exophiala oligosperma]
MLQLLGSLLILLTTVIYRLWIHDLRRFPGPKLAAVSRIPYLWQGYNGNLVAWVSQQHERYGEIVRIAPYELSFTKPEGWDEIYGHATRGRKQTQKDLRFHNDKTMGVVRDIVRANDVDHARYRRNFSHAFSERALNAQNPLIMKYVDLLIFKLKKIALSPDPRVDIVRWYNFTSFDIMSDLTFGDPLGLLESEEYDEFVVLMFASVKAEMMQMVSRYLKWLKPIAKMLITQEAIEKRKNHYDFLRRSVDKRLARHNPRPDIWGLVIEATGEKKMNLEEMYANSKSIMLGGTETSATSLSGITYLLLTNPVAYKTLVEEVRSTFPSEQDITSTKLQQMPYLNACVEEALRMYPPVPGGLPRIVPPEGRAVCGEWIPGDVVVSVHQYSTYRNPKNFKDPNSFRPERWLKDPDFAADRRDALQPFSTGPRNCVGMK